jgi:hypothetical protein
MISNKLKEIFFGNNPTMKAKEGGTRILQLVKKHKINILVSLSSCIVLIAIFFAFTGNGGEDIVKPGTSDNSQVDNQDLVGSSGEIREYGFSEALDHIGEKARVKGEVLRVFTAKSGVTFLDFCEDFSDCPFSAVIFVSDAKKFSDVSKYEREVIITGTIKSYNGKAEIILKSPEQIE